MQDTKVQFSEKEVRVLSDREFFYVKEKATKKIFRLFEDVRAAYKATPEHQAFSFPSATDIASGKVSKGENYRQLPYVILDFPKLFSRESIFAFRTLFWWGHHFSFTLLLRGRALQTYQPILLNNLDQLMDKELYYCINDTPWNHSFDKENYRPVNEFSKQELTRKIQEKSFFKVARKLPLEQWEKVIPVGTETYQWSLTLLQDD